MKNSKFSRWSRAKTEEQKNIGTVGTKVKSSQCI